MEEPPWPKRCGCGAIWSRQEWSRLPFLARWEIDEGPTHELRHCICKTTLAVDAASLDDAGAGLPAAAMQHDTLATLLTENKDELLRRWTRRVLADRSGETLRVEPALCDDIPVFIDELIATLREEGVDSRKVRTMTAKRGVPPRGGAVAVARTLRTTLQEWAEFRAALIELCDHAKVVLEPNRARLVHRAIDEAASRSAIQLEEATSA